MPRPPRPLAVGLGLLLAASASCAANGEPATTQASPLRPGNHTLTVSHGGRARDYIVHVPPAAARDQPLPVMLAFHGGGGNASGFQAYAGLDSVADAEGFLVLYPNGTGPLRQRLLTDPHSPGEYRVNGVLRNLTEFHEAFDVQPGDGMYLAPEERVEIW